MGSVCSSGMEIIEILNYLQISASSLVTVGVVTGIPQNGRKCVFNVIKQENVYKKRYF